MDPLWLPFTTIEFASGVLWCLILATVALARSMD
jgi:hypothetical protein